jgi:ATP-binding cassette subfamily C protein
VKYLKASLALIPQTSRKKYWLLTSIKAAVGIVDVIALGFVGLIGQLALSQSNHESLTGYSARLIQRISLHSSNTKSQFTFLTILVLLFFIGKAILSYLANSKMFNFLAQEEISCGKRLTEAIFSNSLVETKRKSSQQVSQVVTQGTIAAIPRVLGFSSVVVSEGALLVLLGTLFVIFEPTLTVVLSLYFALIAIFMHFLIARPMESYGQTVAATTSDSFQTIQEGIRTFREIFVLNRADYFVRKYVASKKQAADKTAHVLTLTTAPRHIVDTALIVGIALVGVFAFSQNEAGEAARSISFVLIAGTRVAPSLLAIQGALAAIRQAGGESEGVYALADKSSYGRDLSRRPVSKEIGSQEEITIVDGVSIEMRNFSFKYPDRDIYALEKVNISIPAGSLVGVSGESGSGKSTFVDAILGVIEGEGNVTVSGLTPVEFLRQHPGKLGYVPQETVLVQGTISQNVAFGCEDSQIDNELVQQCLEDVGLRAFVETHPGGIYTQVGEFGGFLSGGQKQRIGIARALYTSPNLLVLDESTSALDVDSANVIKKLVETLRGNVTVIIISHQPEFISQCDLHLRFDKGVLT